MTQIPFKQPDFTAQSNSPALPTGWAVGFGLLTLAIPIIASMCSRTVMTFTDFVMVSHLGTDAQAAIMPAGILLFSVISFGAGTLTAVNTFVAQSLGKGDRQSCAAFAWQGIYLGLALGVIVLPVWIVIPKLFALAGHAPHVAAMEVIYVRIGLLGIAPTLVSMAVDNFFNGIHKPIVGLWTTIIAATVNIILDYALIFGHFGAPALGIAGAAIATASAATLQAALLLAWMLRPKIDKVFATTKAWRLDIARLFKLVKVGFPAGIQFCIDVITFAIFTLFLIGQFGTAQLAANNIAFKMLEISFMPTVGLGVALTAATGKAIGQSQHNYAKILTRWGAGMGIIYMGCIGAVYVIFGRNIAALLSDNPDVINWASSLLLLCAIFQIFDALNIIHLSALRGAGDTKWPAVFAATIASVVFIGGGFAMSRFVPWWGALGPWIAATVYIVLLGIGMWWRWHLGRWKRIDLFYSSNEPPAPVSGFEG